MSIYLRLNDVKGSADAKGHEDWISLMDIQFAGVAVSIPLKIGRAADRCCSMPDFGYVSATKLMDKSSVKLFDAAHQAKVFPKAEFHYVTTGTTPFAFSKVTLSNACLTHYSEGFNQELNQPLEMFRLSYTKLERTFVPRDKANIALSPMSAGYNLEEAKRL